MKDITKLLYAATDEERLQIARLIDLEEDQKPAGDELVKHLWWKYQTPVGYALRTPSFDEISIAVAKKFMKVDAFKKYGSCWEMLDKLSSYLMEKALNEGDREEINAAIKKIHIPCKIDPLKLGAMASVQNPLVISSQFAGAMIDRLTLLPVKTTGMLLGSIGWTLMVFQLNSLAGTNWQNIIPTVIYISYIYYRLKICSKLPF